MSGYIIGLTGGVASGKTAVAERFQALGVTVADADVGAREVVAIGSAGLAEIVAAFGTGSLGPDGGLDRAAMRQRVFNDDDARRRLEAIIHPRVRVWLHDACQAAPGPYAIAAIPLLAEAGAGAYPWMHRVLVVDAAETVQMARLTRRDGIDEELAARMLAAQASRMQRLEIADDVIVNDGALSDLDAHVAALDRRYRALAASG